MCRLQVWHGVPLQVRVKTMLVMTQTCCLLTVCFGYGGWGRGGEGAALEHDDRVLVGLVPQQQSHAAHQERCDC